MKKTLALFYFLLIMLPVCGGEADSLLSINKSEILVLPFGFYSNETSVALGIFSQYRSDSDDNIFGNIVYTFKNQFMLFCITDKTFKELIFHNTIKIKDYYSDFYGVGNDTEQEDKIDYSYFMADNLTEIGRSFLKNLNFFFSLNNYYFHPKDVPAFYDSYSSEKNQFTNGPGFAVYYSDVTDKYFRDGLYLKSAFLFYPEFLGNIGEFSIIDSESGVYKSFRESGINLLFSSRFSFGNVHPEKLSYIGGMKIMRGYPDKRYLNSNMLSGQAQYDLRVYKDISACVFLGAGDVFHDFSDMSLNKMKIAYGAGIMYEFRKLILRIEAATSLEKNLEIIITGNRAF